MTNKQIKNMVKDLLASWKKHAGDVLRVELAALYRAFEIRVYLENNKMAIIRSFHFEDEADQIKLLDCLIEKLGFVKKRKKPFDMFCKAVYAPRGDKLT